MVQEDFIMRDAASHKGWQQGWVYLTQYFLAMKHLE